MTYQNRKKRNFTIIELLVVMIIMSIMLVVALPSFTDLGKNHKLAQAAQDVGGQIAIARSYAIANHCTMAVIFPRKSELETLGAEDGTTLPNFYNASCRIALVTKSDDDNDGAYMFVMWKPESNWLILPEGAFIPEGNQYFPAWKGKGGSSVKLKNVRIGDMVKQFKRLPKDSDFETKVDIERYIIINSDGQIITKFEDNNELNDSDTFDILVYEGGYNRQRKDFVLHPRNKGKQFYQKLVIDPLTGRTTYSEEEDK